MNNILTKFKHNRILKNISALFIGRVYTIFIGMISSIIMVRHLGPDNNGVYNYSLALITLFSGVGLLGLDNIIIKEFSKGERKKDEIFFSSMIARIIGTIIACILLEITLIILKCDSRTTLYIWISAISFFINIFSAVTGWYYSISNAKIIVIAQSVSHTASVILRIICALLNKGVLAFLVVQVIETGILLLIEWVFFWRDNNAIHFKVSKKTVWYLIKQGLPICLGSIAYTVFMKVDQIMIENMIGDHELGIYSVAVKIAELWYFVPNTIVVALLPKLTELFTKENKKQFYEYFQKCMSALVLIGYISSIMTMVLAKPIIFLLYGEEFVSAAPILCIYIWSGVFINMSVLRGNYFVITEWTRFSLWVNLMGAIVNVIINYVLINMIGSFGAAVSTLISYAVYAYFSSFAISKLHKVGIIQTKSLFLYGLRSRDNG